MEGLFLFILTAEQIFNLSFDNKIITKSAKNGIDEVLLKLENLDKNEFLNSLLNDGVIINQKQLEKIFEGITNNLIEMRNFQTSNGKKIDKNIFDDLLLTREDTGFIFIDDLNQKKFNI